MRKWAHSYSTSTQMRVPSLESVKSAGTTSVNSDASLPKGTRTAGVLPELDLPGFNNTAPKPHICSPSSTLVASGFVLGCVLLGAGTFRARIYSQLAAALFLAGALILLTPLALDDVVFAAGLIWIGYEIFAGKSEVARNLRRCEPRCDDATAGQARS
jgi:hypothetical protein